MTNAIASKKQKVVVFLRDDYNDKVLLQMIETLITKGLLKKSDLLIWRLLLTNIKIKEMLIYLIRNYNKMISLLVLIG